MRLRPSDIYAPLLRPVGIYSAEYRLADIEALRVWLFRFDDVVPPSDSVYVDMVFAWKPDMAVTSDAIRFSIAPVFKDNVPASDRVRAVFVAKFKSVGAPVDFVKSTFTSVSKDTATPVDRVFSTLKILLRDAVVAGSRVQVDSDSGVGTSEFMAPTDFIYSSFTGMVKSQAGASDNVVVGIRYLIDCFFGGLSFGGSPFGGRTL